MSYTLLSYKTLPESIHLAIGNIDYSQKARGILDKEEWAEYEQIKSESRRSEFISTRHLVKEIFEDAGYSDSDFHLKKDSLGKPYGVAGGRHIFLSIAHSSDHIICGLSESLDLGVDTEPVDRRVNEGLKDRIFHKKERSDLRDLDLMRVWTIKEALVKLEGRGLRTNLNDLHVSKLGEAEFSGRFNDDKCARICSFEYNQHWISIAYYE